MSLGQQLYPHLPFLRRYARALTGSQAHGDAYVRATLEAIVSAPEEFPTDVDARIGLYRTFGAIWASSHLEANLDAGLSTEDSRQALARARLARVTPLPRQALLLTAMEGFSGHEAAYIMDIDASEVDMLVDEAMREIDRQTRPMFSSSRTNRSSRWISKPSCGIWAIVLPALQ
jgi:DNA-directed RNA polymerase specialized sigma24 family protein